MNQNHFEGAIRRLIQCVVARICVQLYTVPNIGRSVHYTDANNNNNSTSINEYHFSLWFYYCFLKYIPFAITRPYAAMKHAKRAVSVALYISDNQIAYCLLVLDRESLTFVVLLTFHRISFRSYFSLFIASDGNINYR